MGRRFFLACCSTLFVMVFFQLVSNHSRAASPDQSAGASFNEVERTKHNLGLSSDQACVFCHTTGDVYKTPQAAGAAPAAQAVSFNPPLWDRKTTVKSFRFAPLSPAPPDLLRIPETRPQSSYPFGPSSACLTCHDDALAAGIHDPQLNHPIASAYPRQPNGHFVARRNTPDLFRYWSIPDRTLSGISLPTGPHSEHLSLPAGSDSKDPAVTSRLVRTTLGFIHCDSCHNPHNDSTAPFLRASSKTLCLICHDR